MCLAPKVGDQKGAVFPTAQNSAEWAFGRRPADVSPEAWADRAKGEAAARESAARDRLGAGKGANARIVTGDFAVQRSVTQAQRNWWKDNPQGYQAQTGDVADAAAAGESQRRRRMNNTPPSAIANGAVATVGTNTLLGS